MTIAGWDRREFFGGAGLAVLAALGSAAARAQEVPPAAAGTAAGAMPGEAALAEAMHHMAGVIERFPAEFASLGAPATETDLAEGYRLFIRYLVIGIDQYIQYGDPAFPAFFQNTRDGVLKFAGDSPGQLYDGVSVSGEYDYVVSGKMQDTALIEFTLYSGSLNQGAGKRRLIDSLTDEKLVTDRDGNFTVHLKRQGTGPNVLQLAPDASKLLVRRYLRDPVKDHPRPLAIRRVSGSPVLAPPSPVPLSQAIAAAADFAMWNVRTWAQWVVRDRSREINVFLPFNDTGDIYTPAGHRYLSGYWRVPDGKALLVEFTPPQGAYWTFVPMNFWMESFEWRFGNRVYASSYSTPPGKDGVVRFALAAADPRLPGVQWIETMGHGEGPMSLRMARHHGPMPDVRCTLVSANR